MHRAPRGRLASAFGRHRGLVLVLAVVVTGFLTYGLAVGADLAVAYAVLVVGATWLILWVEPEGGFSRLVVVGLVVWAVGHLAGGNVPLSGGRNLYGAGLPGGLQFDNVVHFVGLTIAGVGWWEATRPWLKAEPTRRLGIWTAVWLASMGIGTTNEVAEYVSTLVLPQTDVGGFDNMGRDLIANMLGGAMAGVIIARRSTAERSPTARTGGGRAIEAAGERPNGGAATGRPSARRAGMTRPERSRAGTVGGERSRAGGAIGDG